MAVQDFFEPCRFLDKATKPDGHGSVIETYRPGAEFEGEIVTDSSSVARVAYQEGVSTIYTVVTMQTVPIAFGSVIQRLRDGLTVEITQDPGDFTPPARSSFKYWQAQAKRRRITL